MPKGKHGSFTPTPPRPCEWCGKPFQPRNYDKVTRFCGKSCSSSWRMTIPEIRAKVYTPKNRELAREIMRGLWQRPGFAEAVRARNARPDNPIFRPDVRRRAREAADARWYAHLDGGNGTVSPAEAALSDALEWPMGVVVKTGRAFGLPNSVKLDVASEAHRVAIEIDGNSHRSTAVREKDGRKQAFLESIGWLVLRFTNAEVLRDPQAVAEKVRAVAAA